jgi:hypothetical protein
MSYRQFRQLIAYALFLLVAAPLEFNLSAYFNGLPEALITGFLYSFAVVASIEALYRLETHPGIPTQSWPVDALKLLSLVPLILFTLEVIPSWSGDPDPTRHLHAEHAKWQAPAAVIGLLVAILTHMYVTRIEPPPSPDAEPSA